MSVDTKLLLFDRNYYKDTLLSAAGIVRKYIADNNLVIVGGMAIDMALRLKGGSIYGDKQLPDYDFLSPNFYDDAFKLGKILFDMGYKHVSVIPRLHYGTVSVRVEFMSVADISYCPQDVFAKIPVLNYFELKIVHPHFQAIDQHLSLSHPYENPPMETIFHRWEKDTERYFMIMDKYPPQDGEFIKGDFISKVKENRDMCIGGNEALIFWAWTAKKEGFSVTFSEGELVFTSKYVPPFPKKVFYTDHFEDFDKKDYFASFMNKLPRHVENETECVYDNYGFMIGAVKIGSTFVSGLQLLMAHISTYGIFEGDSYKPWYKMLFDIFKHAVNENVSALLPNEIVYGKYMWNGAQQVCVLSTFGEKDIKDDIKNPPVIRFDPTVTQPKYDINAHSMLQLSGQKIGAFLPHVVGVR